MNSDLIRAAQKVVDLYDAYRRRGVAPARVEYEDFAESVDIILRAAAQPTTLTNEEIENLIAREYSPDLSNHDWCRDVARAVEAEARRRCGVVE